MRRAAHCTLLTTLILPGFATPQAFALSRFEAAAMVRDLGLALGCELDLPKGDTVAIDIAEARWTNAASRASCVARRADAEPPIDSLRVTWSHDHLTLQAGINQSLTGQSKIATAAPATTRRAWIEIAAAKHDRARGATLHVKSIWPEYDGYYMCRSFNASVPLNTLRDLLDAFRSTRQRWIDRVIPDARWHLDHDKFDNAVSRQKRVSIPVMSSDTRQEIFSCLQNQRVSPRP